MFKKIAIAVAVVAVVAFGFMMMTHGKATPTDFNSPAATFAHH